MSDETKTEKKDEKTDKAEKEISKIAEKTAASLTFGSSLGRYWFVYLLGTIGGAGLGALLGWSTGRLLELADWLGITIGSTSGAVVGFGAAAGVTRQLDKNTINAINGFAIEAEKAMKAQETRLNGEISTLRTGLKEALLKELNGEIESVKEDVEALGTQIGDVPTPKKRTRKTTKQATTAKPVAKKRGRKKAA